ncbi:STAS domain-containing protein [Streptomyces sp. NPDC029721]|uniref:STAS domain-containing protein n=1 Tax=Streptomyces sp. NPDC029721 TaxID=3157090 RepID=UPI0033DEBEEA
MPASFAVAVNAVGPSHTVVAVTGELDIDTGPDLAKAIDALELPGLVLTVDMTAVTFMDSSGLNTLLRLRRRTGRDGGALHLFGVPDQALRVLDLTGTTHLFHFLPSPGALGRAETPVGARLGSGPTGRCEACGLV